VSSRRPRTGILAVLVAVALTVLAPATAAAPAGLVVHEGSGGTIMVAHWGGSNRFVTFYRLRVMSHRRHRAPDTTPPLVSASVGSTPVGASMPPGYVGLSIEYHALIDYLGRDPAALNPVFLALIRGLNPGQSPVLRIGGNTTDQTWWPMPGMIAPGGINYALNTDWLQVAHALAGALDARMVLGINLAADSPAIAAAEARALIAGIGRSHIAALEIGNEPDLYTRFAWYRDRSTGKVYFSRPQDYAVGDFLSEYARWRAAMPSAPLAGPTFASANWMEELPAFLSGEPGISLITFHRYPLRGCETNASLSDYASIPNLMNDSSSSGLAQQVAPFAAAAHAANVPFRLDELNSASCAGKLGVSNTFASALWALDTLFNLASVGVDGVNIHTLPGAPYQPFSFTQNGTQWTATVRPLYYGLLMFEQAFPAGARLLSVSAPAGPVKVWATRDATGRVRVVVINKDPKTNVVVRVQVPGATGPVTSEALSAPSLAATSGVSLGGQSFASPTSTGTLAGSPRTVQISPVLGSYAVSVPAGSAVLLTR
jgi:hypothetical protein